MVGEGENAERKPKEAEQQIEDRGYGSSEGRFELKRMAWYFRKNIDSSLSGQRFYKGNRK